MAYTSDQRENRMALEGSLHDLSLIDLIELFRTGVKTGVLWLIGGGEQGAVYVRAGCLIDAVLLRGPARQVIATADDALIRLLQWQDAQFTFQTDSDVDRHPARMVHDHEWLLREALRQREHALEAPPEPSITLDTCFALARSPGTTGVFRLDLAQWRIFCQVAIRPSARAICARSGVAPDQALAGLAQLLALGLVEVV
jgi:Domain of unknown function (DUF4388)